MMSQCISPLAFFMLLLSVMALTTMTNAFMPQQQRSTVGYPSQSSSPLFMAGFGGGASNKGKKKKQKKKDALKKKLKPKQQWDRYTNDLSDADRVRVAVRVVKSTRPATSSATTTNDECWFQVGFVKSKDNAFTQAAVICQRAIMVQHARRMFPLLILANDVLEWGYTTLQGEVFDDECWVVVPNNRLLADNDDDESTSYLPNDVDKMIGFQGLEDPTGFYAFHKKSELALESKVAGNFESINAQRIHDN